MTMNGKLAFRNTLQGKNDGRLPFVPFIYGLAARTANVSLREMAEDASYYTNALEGVYGLLGHDVIVGNFDTTLESESFGCEVEWPGEYGAPNVVSPVRNSSGALNPSEIIAKYNSAAEKRNIISNGVNRGLLSGLRPEEFMRRGRIPVVMEVTKRLTLSLGRDVAVACALTGPCSFLETVKVIPENTHTGNKGEAIKLLRSFFTKLVRSLCELKIDALLFREDPLGREFTEELFQNKEDYKALYGTLFNIVRAFNAFPVVVTKHLSLEAIKDVHGLLRPGSIVLLGNMLGDSDLGFIKDIANSLKLSFGVPLPIGTGTQEELWNQLSAMESFVSKYRPKNLFYTSDGEIPHDIPMEILHILMDRLRAGSEQY